MRSIREALEAVTAELRPARRGLAVGVGAQGSASTRATVASDGRVEDRGPGKPCARFASGVQICRAVLPFSVLAGPGVPEGTEGPRVSLFLLTCFFLVKGCLFIATLAVILNVKRSFTKL